MTTIVSERGVSTVVTEVESGRTIVSQPAGVATVVSRSSQPGLRGAGVPSGGTTGQVLGKLSDADLHTGWVDETGGGSGAVASVNTQTGDVVLDAADVGADVAGTAAAALATAASYTDAETARAESAEGALSTALSGKAASSALTAEVTRATTAEGVNASAITAEATARSNADAAEVIARNAAIATAVAGVLGGAPGALDTLKELADAINDDASFAATITTALAGKQPLDSDLTAIAALSTTAFGRAFLTMADAAATKTALALVKGDVGLGNADNTSDANKPVSTAQAAADTAVQTAAASDATTKVATETSRATTAEALLAPLASPALTGNPTAPTQAALNSSTRLSTTAYADSAVAVEKARAQTAEALAVQTGTNPASGVSVTTSGLVVVTHTNVQAALADLDAATATALKINGAFGPGTLPTGAIVETISRKLCNTSIAAPTTLRGSLVHLAAGTVITSLTFLSGTTALATGTHQWFAVLDTSGKVLAVTSDDTSAAWAANATKTLNLTSPLTAPSTGGYYLTHCVNATTPNTFTGFSNSGTTLAITPFASVTANGGTTGPVAVNTTLTLAGGAATDYGYAS